MLFQNNPPPPPNSSPSPPPNDTSPPPPPPSELIFPDQAEGSSDCPLPPPPPPPPRRRRPLLLPPPSIRISSEFDSESSLLSNKVSWRIFNGVAKIKTQFQRNKKGEVSKPRVGFITKHLSLLYDVEERNGLVSGLFNIGKRVLVEGDHNLKEKHGFLKVVAALPDPSYKVELLSPLPSVGLPRAALKFPHGEIRVEAKEDEIQKALSALSFSGILRGNMMNGLCAAQFKDEALHLRYSYKDKEVTFTPSIYLPSNVLSLAFKRRFSPSDKLSYSYNFSSNNWSTVYKHTFGDDFKVKAGYDSDVNLGWASLWVGKEQAGAKTAPMKVKFQVMLQVPKDRMNEAALMFRVKKRWDI